MEGVGEESGTSRGKPEIVDGDRHGISRSRAPLDTGEGSVMWLRNRIRRWLGVDQAIRDAIVSYHLWRMNDASEEGRSRFLEEFNQWRQRSGLGG